MYEWSSVFCLDVVVTLTQSKPTKHGCGSKDMPPQASHKHLQCKTPSETTQGTQDSATGDDPAYKGQRS